MSCAPLDGERTDDNDADDNDDDDDNPFQIMMMITPFKPSGSCSSYVF